MPRFDTISFLSDYGLQDEFVGVCKAVIRRIAPHVTVLDICHEIPPHDVRAGSLALARAAQYLPAGVVLGIVDPGVGGERRAVAVEVSGGEGGEGGEGTAVFVGPDNGVLASAVALAGGAGRAVALTNSEYHLPAPGPTFAGRDIFAPAAAYLCSGVDLAELGEAVDPLTLLPGILPLTRAENGRVVGEVLWVDRFGNVQLNVDPAELEPMGDAITLRFGDQVRTAVRALTYDELGPGQIGLVVDSYGLVSVALARRSAADELRLSAPTAVSLEAAAT
ncbi:MAG: SAM-dependent chlorinase/fluorinase [Acidimicrobiia bacterium]|nr:SAM-dependent chlorinase/fluorinase [Acidimicrobiia bacterium]